MIELKGITVPVVIIKIQGESSLDKLKEELKFKLRKNLFKSSYFVIEESSSLSKEELYELEKFLHDMNFKNVVGIQADNNNKDKERRLLIVDHCLRSGQRVEHGGDILVLGDVNRDAEVIATGNIIVTGALRGIVHAGALGDDSAVIVAYKMEPQRISIGSVIAIVNDSEKVSPGYPEIARVENGKIVLDRV